VSEEKFAGFVVKIDDEVVAKVTSLTMNDLTITEAEVTGSEDVVEGGDILGQKFAPIAVGETASVEGIVWKGNSGQSELKQAARQGSEVELSAVNSEGNGVELMGFFTAYQEPRSTGDVAKFTTSFRVNSNNPVESGS